MISVSFHSYKGGACRTSTCYNTLPFLVEELEATPDRPLLVIDADLESQGLTYLFETENIFRNQKQYNAKDLFSGTPMRNYREQCVPVGEKVGVENESIYFLGINDKMKFVAQNSGGQLQVALGYLFNEDFAGIIFDTASGDQLSASASNRMSDVIVCCMRPTKQFRIGTFSFLSRIGSEWVKEGDEQVRKVIVLPTAVPRAATVIDGKDQHEDSLSAIEQLSDRIDFEICEKFLKPDCYGIPEVARFKWKEDVLYRLDKDNLLNYENDAREALGRYQDLAKTIVEEGGSLDA